MSLFKPYLTADWAKQRKAVDGIRDEKKLTEILLSDMRGSGLLPRDQTNLRQLCLERITDQKFLTQFYMSLEKKELLEAFGHSTLVGIKDQGLLNTFVRRHPSDYGKWQAARHLSDARRLISVVADGMLPADVRCVAMERLRELKQTDWSQDDERLFARIAMDRSENGELRALCGEQITDEDALCKLILSFADDKRMQRLCLKSMEDERIKNPALLKQIALSDNFLSIRAAERIDPGDARDVFMKTAAADIETAAMEKMTVGELLPLFDGLPKDSPKREHIVTWIPADYAPAAWWCQRRAEYPQHSDIFMHRLFQKRCSFALIEALEKRVSEGDHQASVQLRWLYSEADLPEPFAQHAARQKKRFRDEHHDGPRSYNCAGHMDYVVKNGLIEPL